jgi:hypothetical protein
MSASGSDAPSGAAGSAGTSTRAGSAGGSGTARTGDFNTLQAAIQFVLIDTQMGGIVPEGVVSIEPQTTFSTGSRSTCPSGIPSCAS